MSESGDAKLDALRESGTYNLAAEDVLDDLFAQHEFFDARDLVQVKYEMLRRVREDAQSVTAVAQRFGFSRTAYYQTASVFEEQGMRGLIPKSPGPKEAHKLTTSVMEFLEEQLAEQGALKSAEMVALVAVKFGISVHPRSIERALARQRKKGR